MDTASNLSPALIRPLTRTSEQTGLPYRRDNAVEMQIASALTMKPEALAERAKLPDVSGPEYLKEECLVYLIREYHMGGHDALVSELSAELLRRSDRMIRAKLQKLGVERFEEANDEIVEMLFSRILDFRSDRGDYFQVRYWLFLKRLLADVYSKHLELLKRAANEVSPGWVYGSEPDSEETGTQYVAPVAAGGLSAEERVLVSDALGRLGEPYKTLIVLRYYEDWPVESEDEGVMTISRYFDKTPRTIRNWLATASSRLQAWQEGAL